MIFIRDFIMNVLHWNVGIFVKIITIKAIVACKWCRLTHRWVIKVWGRRYVQHIVDSTLIYVIFKWNWWCQCTHGACDCLEYICQNRLSVLLTAIGVKSRNDRKVVMKHLPRWHLWYFSWCLLFFGAFLCNIYQQYCESIIRIKQTVDNLLN